MSVVDKLNEWKTKSNGEFSTFSTITIKSDTLNVSVTGKDLEDAFLQIEAICGEKKGEQVTPAPTFPQTQPAQQVIPSITKPKSIQEALNGKQLVRIHGTEPLNVGESLIEFNGIAYVVR